METLPYIDTHTVVSDAPPEAVWESVRAAFDRPVSGLFARYARLVGVRGDRPFVVATAEPGSLLALVGEHHFSRYALTFETKAHGAGGTELSARTDAVFPGVAGQLYKTAVIRSRAHRVLTRAMLRRIARRAER